MEQFLTGDIWKEVNKLLTRRQKKIACIAYVTSETLELTKGDILICDASEYEIKFGATSAKTLQTYFNRGIKIYSNQLLHSKILLTDTFLVICSANLSRSSAEKLIESSIVTYSNVLISQAKAFCHNLTEESTLLSEKDIQTLLKIKVVKRPSKPKGNSKTRQKKFGNRYWFTSASPLNERTYNKIKDTVEKTTTSISKTTEIEADDISFLRMSSNTVFSKTAKEGDQILLKFYNTNKTRIHIYPPSTILKKEVDGNFTIFYHDNRDAEERKVSWTKFQAFLKTMVLEKNMATRTKTISENDVKKLKPIWKK